MKDKKKDRKCGGGGKCVLIEKYTSARQSKLSKSYFSGYVVIIFQIGLVESIKGISYAHSPGICLISPSTHEEIG